MKHVLYTQDLAIGYRHKKREDTLHRNIKLTLNPGELTCLLGPNGAGKSTLVRTLAGSQYPLQGQVFLDNTEISKYRNKDLACMIGIVLTSGNQPGNMSVFELVSLGRHPYTNFFGKLDQKDKEKINHALKIVGIPHMKDRMVSELSDGERQKVMIAKALAQETPILILDEPTAFLDLPSRMEIMKLLHELSREMSKAILVTSHDLQLALQFADKMWLMAQNEPITTGTPEDLVLEDSFSRFFERSGIRFDRESGNFNMNFKNGKSVGLKGEGPEYQWLAKALAKNGYSIDSKAPVQVTIHNQKENNKYRLSVNQQEEEKVSSIGQLLKMLKKYE